MTETRAAYEMANKLFASERERINAKRTYVLDGLRAGKIDRQVAEWAIEAIDAQYDAALDVRNAAIRAALKD